MNYDFMSWLDTPIADDWEAVAAGRSEYLALHLSEIVQEIEKESNVEVLSVEEKAVGLELLDKLIRFLTAANADLVLAVDRGSSLYKASDNNGATLNLSNKKVHEFSQDFAIEVSRESDGRWIAEVVNIPGVRVYGETRKEAIKEVKILTLSVLADKLKHDEVVVFHIL